MKKHNEQLWAFGAIGLVAAYALWASRRTGATRPSATVTLANGSTISPFDYLKTQDAAAFFPSLEPTDAGFSGYSRTAYAVDEKLNNQGYIISPTTGALYASSNSLGLPPAFQVAPG